MAPGVLHPAAAGSPASQAKPQVNPVSSSAANGTCRADTSPCSIRPARMDPPPTPAAKPVSSRVMTWAPPLKSCLAMTGNSVRNVAPTVQNQDRPRMLSHTGRLARAARSRARVSAGTFQPIRRPGAAGDARGTRSAASQARRRPPAARPPRPRPGRRPSSMSWPPAMVPARMAAKVPASMSALPDSSSPGRRCSGEHAVLQRAEEGGLHAQPEQRRQQQRHAVREEAQGRDRHDGDLQRLRQPDQPGLVQLVRHLPRRGGEQGIGQDEQPARQRDKLRRFRPCCGTPPGPRGHS